MIEILKYIANNNKFNGTIIEFDFTGECLKISFKKDNKKCSYSVSQFTFEWYYSDYLHEIIDTLFKEFERTL